MLLECVSSCGKCAEVTSFSFTGLPSNGKCIKSQCGFVIPPSASSRLQCQLRHLRKDFSMIQRDLSLMAPWHTRAVSWWTLQQKPQSHVKVLSIDIACPILAAGLPTPWWSHSHPNEDLPLDRWEKCLVTKTRGMGQLLQNSPYVICLYVHPNFVPRILPNFTKPVFQTSYKFVSLKNLTMEYNIH